MTKKLKLYVWENVLVDYTAGIMFAFAENVDEARALIMAEEGGDGVTVLNDLKAEPQEITTKAAFLIWGGG